MQGKGWCRLCRVHQIGVPVRWELQDVHNPPNPQGVCLLLFQAIRIVDEQLIGLDYGSESG